MSKEMSQEMQKKILLIGAAINTLVACEGEEKVSSFIKKVHLDKLLVDMEEYFGECPYDPELLYSIVTENIESLRNFKEE